MILTRSNVVHYLLDRGVVGLDSVVDGDLVVADATRRNRNFKIIRQKQQGYFVKQIRNWDPQSVASLACEANCYRLAQSGDDLASLAALVPRHVLYDSARHTLVTELLPNSETLSDHHRRMAAFPPEVAQLLGQLLGNYHRDTDAQLGNHADASAFPRQMPWILSMHQHSAQLFSALSAANSQVLQIVQSYPEFARTLDELRQDWRADRLVHGDIKWDNCVVYHPHSADDGLQFKIVDWELADIGDPCWDVGALLQAYLSFWVLSMRMSAETPPTQFADTAQYPIESMHPAIRAFWQSYVDALGLDREAGAALLTRSMKFGAARMIQTAYEYMQYSPQISANALCLLQVSFNILKDPEDAVTNLLDL